ncbi:fumarylacetoacetate hydrolase family protein [Variovorax sp. VNK109]|jgi:5-oxopent-3-ene-1,2,5-tricarboxylate decarboxylase/2-hydroxyhepta-2,4-diene-1,7-dioate isomerase|uniref:fumarylacetoacetate hydrolase family protein n=1 Tax=Variovorax sp. VNK109 TaxID=3400919 RepID=UPI003C011252
MTTTAVPAAGAYLPQGTVYGTLLNFRSEFDAWAPKMNEAPYKAPPNAPILYVKPVNTWSTSGAAIPVPASAPQVEVGATIAMVIGDKPNTVAGYVLMNDVSLPHASFFRPPVKFKCLDGFLGIGNEVVDAAKAGDPSAFTLDVRVNGEVRQSSRFSGLVRNAQQLLADVSSFMTLQPGDVLMLGCDITADGARPLVKVGDRVEIRAPGFAPLVNTFVAEAA